MEHVRRILGELCSIRTQGYGDALPGKHDEKFFELAEIYATSDSNARSAIRNMVADDCRLFLLGFGDRVATLAARTSSDRLVFLALVAHSIEDFRYDARENIVRLALINHVAQRIGVQPSALFERVAQLSSEGASAELREFQARRPESKSMDAMGIAETQTDEGIDYHYK